MGFFDLPSPLFAWVDAQLSGLLSPLPRLALWAVLAAVVSMGLYAWLSPQSHLSTLKAQLLAARRAVNTYDGDFGGVWPLMRRMLGLSFRQVGMVIGPVLLASLPILFLLVWISNAYGPVFPPSGSDVAVSVHPAGFKGEWEGADAAGVAHIVVGDGVGEREALALKHPVQTLHKYRWWNALIANPAGYLPDSTPVERIDVALPQRQLLAIGPAWARSWELPFFAVLILCSLLLKLGFHIQ